MPQQDSKVILEECYKLKKCPYLHLRHPRPSDTCSIAAARADPGQLGPWRDSEQRLYISSLRW